MHLFYLNITPQILHHWQGFFLYDGGNYDSSDESPIDTFSRPEKYCISQKSWKEIDEDLARSAKLLPGPLGEQVRSIKDLKKAAQWKTWAHLLSPILLKGRLPDPYYSQWIALIKAFRLATNPVITSKDIDFIGETMLAFVHHYEAEYYQFKFHRLSACKPVIHALLHVAACIKKMGPMWSYGQWTTERMVGLWTPKVKLRSNANRNLSLAMLRTAQIYSLSLTTCLYFKTAENTNLETGTPPDNPLYSFTWQGILDRIQVFNGKEEEPDMEAPAGTQSPQHLATLHFRKCIRPLTTAHSHAFFSFLDSLSIAISQPHLTLSEFQVEVWSHCRLNKLDAKRNIGSPYLRCQKYQKMVGKDSSHVRYIYKNPCFHSFSTDHQNFCFAQVLFFFSVSVETTGHGVVHLLLALINTISVIEHGDLFKIDRRKSRQTEVINIDCIAGLVGLVRKKDDTYIVY